MIRLVAITLLLAAPGAWAAHAAQDPMAAARAELIHHHGGDTAWLALAERMEHTTGDGMETIAWEARGWWGTDIDRLWLASEGEYDLDEASIEGHATDLLYSRAVSAWWNAQAGARHVRTRDATRAYAVLGLQGIAPHWLEVDTALHLSEQGDLSARLETEYDLRLTRRWLLQANLEFKLAASDDEAMGVRRGLNEIEAGLRLRYEVTRQAAPYLGLTWKNHFGRTADLRDERGEQSERFAWVAGIRFWL